MALFNFRTKQNQLTTPYFANNIGFTSPAGEHCYEFLVIGKTKGKDDDFQNKIVSLFIENDVLLLSFNIQVNNEKKQFTLALRCDLAKCGVSPVELSDLVRKLGFVTTIEYQELRGLMYGRSFPLVLYNSHRALALRSSTLIRLGNRLARDVGTLGTSALFDEGRSYILEVIEDFRTLLSQSISFLPLDGYGVEENVGGQDTSVKAYCVKCKASREVSNPKQVILRNAKPAVQGTCPVCSTKMFKIGIKMLPKIRSSLLLENVQGFLLASGWGTFELRGEIWGKVGSVTILDPPTFEHDVSYGNQFLEGIASGLLEAISKSRNRMAFLGQRYDPINRILTLHFGEQLQVQAQLMNEEPAAPQASVPSKISLIKNVRRIHKQTEKKISSESEESAITSLNKPRKSDILTEEPELESSGSSFQALPEDKKIEVVVEEEEEQKQEVENIIQSLNEIAEEAKKAIPQTIEDEEEDQEGAELLVPVKEKKATNV